MFNEFINCLLNYNTILNPLGSIIISSAHSVYVARVMLKVSKVFSGGAL